jgi:lysyl-tRNA synthetase class 2
VTGNPHRTSTSELSINCVELPTVLSPILATLPNRLEDPTTRIKHRHVDMLVNREVADRLRARSHIIQCMRDYFINDNFLEVQTPLITDKASGAIAKSFKTVATEFSSKELALRIAPELWLKRLVIGGMDRVFEIGPSFRNEGLDATHNPEFTTCEFYKSYTDLNSLMKMTEDLFTSIASKVKSLREFPLRTLPEFDQSLVSTPFNRIEFIPGIEKAMGKKLPNLAADDASEQLIELFKEHDHPLPSRPTLPRLLDRLASIYIEPLCTSATFIIHHPSCMAPLAKSFLCPKTSQLVSARAELFISCHEIANMYEEENSPFEQRAKFVQQGKFIDDENEGYVDESYINALESALPPTGGWGAGVDRIVMLFSGTKRIADVLSFGSLRNVVHLGNTSPIAEEGKDETSAAPLGLEKEKLALQAM